MKKYKWLEWAKELQFIAQAGLTYSKDPFDIERFERIREISAEIVSSYSDSQWNEYVNFFVTKSDFKLPN